MRTGRVARRLFAINSKKRRRKRRPNGPGEQSPGLNKVMPWDCHVRVCGGLKGRESVAVVSDSQTQGIAALSPGLSSGGPLGRDRAGFEL